MKLNPENSDFSYWCPFHTISNPCFSCILVKNYATSPCCCFLERMRKSLKKVILNGIIKSAKNY